MSKTQLPILLWSCAFVGSGNDSREDVNFCINRWKERRALLENQGVELKLYTPRRDLMRERIFPVLDFFRREDDDFIVECPGRREYGKEEIYDQDLMWPRDNFQIYGEHWVAPRSFFNQAQEVARQLKLDLHPVSSATGSGGYVIRLPRICIFSAIPQINEKALEGIKNEGYSYYLMPFAQESHTTTREGKRLFSMMKHNNHLDTELNCAQTSDGNVLLTVNADYVAVFRREVEELRSALDARLHVVENKREIYSKAVNYVQLPNGAVVLSDRHPRLAEFLIRNIGADKVFPIQTFKSECSSYAGSGGIRCRTNLVYDYL